MFSALLSPNFMPNLRKIVGADLSFLSSDVFWKLDLRQCRDLETHILRSQICFHLPRMCSAASSIQSDTLACNSGVRPDSCVSFLGSFRDLVICGFFPAEIRDGVGKPTTKYVHLQKLTVPHNNIRDKFMAQSVCAHRCHYGVKTLFIAIRVYFKPFFRKASNVCSDSAMGHPLSSNLISTTSNKFLNSSCLKVSFTSPVCLHTSSRHSWWLAGDSPPPGYPKYSII